MPKVYALTCPHCRAPLPTISPDQAIVVCEYCNQSSNVSHTMHMPAAPRPASTPRPLPPRTPLPPRLPDDAERALRRFAAIEDVVRSTPSRGARLIARLIARLVVIAIVIGVIVGVVVPAVKAVRTSRQLFGTAPAVAESGSMQWMDGPLVTTDIDGDGDEDVVGFYRVVGSTKSNPMYVGGFTSQGWKRLWRSPALGESGNYRAMLSVVGDAVLVSDDKGLVRVLDRKTGAERRQIRLTDRAAQICAVDATHAWIRVDDETSVLADLVAGDTTPTPRPASCSEPAEREHCSWWSGDNYGTPNASCVANQYSRVTIPEMSISYALRAGPHDVAAGTKPKGTQVSMLAGFDATARKRAPLWVRRVNPDPAAMTPTSAIRTLDLAGDSGFLAYESERDVVKLQRFDASTGAIQYEVTIPDGGHSSLPNSLTITAQRIYVPHFVWLDIFDGKTGAHLHRIGHWL